MINYLNLQNNNANFKNRKDPVGARLLYGDVISHSLKISNNLSHKELLLKIELKMYQDIGLDPTKEYKITYVQKDVELENQMLIEAFAIDKNLILEKYQKHLKFTKHIDFLALPFLSFETLYTNKILMPKNDIFIYISRDEAFTTSFQDGRYISSKRLNPLVKMVEDLNARDIVLTCEELEVIISQKGLDKSKYDLLEQELYEYLFETFGELFSKIKNLSLHHRNVYNFSQIDRIFISSSGKPIELINPLIENYIEDAKVLTLNFLKSETLDVLDAISQSYIKDKISQNDNRHNLTIFEKKAPFHKSEVGKFTFVVAASIILSCIYPIYLNEKIGAKTIENEALKIREQSISKSSKKLKVEFKALKSKLALLKSKQQEDLKKLQKLQSIADTLLSLQSKDTQYTAMFLEINRALKAHKLSIDKITQSDAHVLDLELFSQENRRDSIALFMKDLLNAGFNSVISGEITSSDDRYKSIITVKR